MTDRARPGADVIRYEWPESKTNQMVVGAGCAGLVGLFIFWPLGVIGLLVAGVAGMAGAVQEKVTAAVYFCGACHKRLPSDTVTSCHACQTRFEGVDVRRFATAAEALAEQKRFGVAR